MNAGPSRYWPISIVGRPWGAWLYGIAGKELSHYFRRQSVERRATRRLGLERPELVPVFHTTE
jgi:hypothetical protein